VPAADWAPLADAGGPWLALPATPEAAGLARRFLLGALRRERDEVVDVVLLLASELVANAVVHGEEPIRLQLHRHGDVLRVEVRDGGLPFVAPAAGAWSGTDESGRGLLLLHALARSWGNQSNSDATTGKTMWFELPCREPALAATTP
jgi:anti-sigma regulatory factor (Ser/Thr protein kinase)